MNKIISIIIFTFLVYELNAQTYTGLVGIYEDGVKEMLDSSEWDDMTGLVFKHKAYISFNDYEIDFWGLKSSEEFSLTYSFTGTTKKLNLISKLKNPMIPAFLVKDTNGNHIQVKFFSGLFENENIAIFVIPDLKNKRTFFLMLENNIFEEINDMYKL